MKRKLVKQGASTLMISIPSKWAKQFNLDKGDELEVEENGRSLIMSAEGGKALSENSINLSSLTESSIRTGITNAYRIGYDRIILNFSDRAAFPIIKEVVEKNLLGFEIIKKTENSCIIENVTEPAKEQFNNIFSKALMNIDELFVTVEDMLNGKKIEFEDTERNIMKYDAFCRRILLKSGNVGLQPLQWAFHSETMHGQRELYFLLRYLSKNKVKVLKETFSLLKETKKIFDTLKEAYDKRSIPLLEKVHDLEKDIAKQAIRLMEQDKNSLLVHYLFDAARKFYLAGSPLIGILISETKIPLELNKKEN